MVGGRAQTSSPTTASPWASVTGQSAEVEGTGRPARSAEVTTSPRPKCTADSTRNAIRVGVGTTSNAASAVIATAV